MFNSWDKTKAILHDPVKPERVYAVLSTGHGCGKKARNQVGKERKRIELGLENLAVKLTKNQAISGAREQHLLALFPSRKPSVLRKAAQNIRCQSGVRNGFVAGLKRFNQYADLVDTVLAENGLPPDIRYLPFVESSYNPKAYSKAGAAGMWQIMPKTARSLGLELNATIDERLDPEAATRAAARYFLNANKSLGNAAREIDPGISQSELNPFVITSYNYGINGMRRAIRQVRPDYLEVLEKYKSPSFRVAVKNFYASFLAARHLAINADQYFGTIQGDRRSQYHTHVLQHDTSMARIKKVFGVAENDLKALNPGLTRYVWRNWRMVPAGYRLRLPARKDRWQSELAQLASLKPEQGVPGGGKYKVKRGDTACGIARALRVNCRELISANRLGKKAVIRVGQTLIIPGQVSQSAVASSSPTQSTHRVRKGDTACGIARRYGVSCKTLISLNSLGRKARIYPGQQLDIPGRGGSTPATGLDANNRYLVKKGDSACLIASRYGVSCGALKTANKLNKKATIYPGQKLTIPGLVVESTEATASEVAAAALSNVAQNNSQDTAGADARPAQQAAAQMAADREQSALLTLLDTLPNLEVTVTGNATQAVYTVRVEADETLGHFADWLGLRSSQPIRKANNLARAESLKIGKRLILPISAANQVKKFEQQRLDYHQVLSESIKEHYVLEGIQYYQVKSGDSIWSMSNQLGFPVWLLYRLNPILRSTRLKPGQEIKLPKLKARA